MLVTLIPGLCATNTANLRYLRKFWVFATQRRVFSQIPVFFDVRVSKIFAEMENVISTEIFMYVDGHDTR
jgi:hypothetical protein